MAIQRYDKLYRSANGVLQNKIKYLFIYLFIYLIQYLSRGIQFSRASLNIE